MFNSPYLAALLGRVLNFYYMSISSIAPSLISAAGSLAGGAIGAFAQNSANETQMNMFHEQMRFNRDMIREQNAYNTPAAQRARYEEAGINPYLALGNISSGSQQSTMQAPNAPQIAPITQFGESLQAASQNTVRNLIDLSQAQADLQIKEEQRKGLAIDNLHKDDVYLADIGLKKSQKGKLDSEKTAQDINNLTLPDINNMNLAQLSALVGKTKAETDLLQVQKELASFDLGFKQKHAEEQFKAELAKTVMETITGYKNADSNRMNAIANLKNADTNRMDAITRRNVGNAQIQNLAADTAKKVEERTGIHLDNVTKARVIEFTVGQYKAALQKTQAETADILNHNWRDKWAQGWINKHTKNPYDKDRYGGYQVTFGSLQQMGDIFRSWASFIR